MATAQMSGRHCLYITSNPTMDVLDMDSFS